MEEQPTTENVIYGIVTVLTVRKPHLHRFVSSLFVRSSSSPGALFGIRRWYRAEEWTCTYVLGIDGDTVRRNERTILTVNKPFHRRDYEFRSQRRAVAQPGNNDDDDNDPSIGELHHHLLSNERSRTIFEANTSPLSHCQCFPRSSEREIETNSGKDMFDARII
jgi:hypothetical protein